MSSFSKVSVITVSLNSADTIHDTIRSVKNQTYPNIEYIVIDGGSTDGTVAILEESEAHIDYWVSEADEGHFDAMNKGIRISSGEIIGILNSDDWYEPEAVETAARVFERRDDVDLVHGSLRILSEEGNVDGIYGSKAALPPTLTAPFSHPTCFVHRRVYRQIGTFNTDVTPASDYDFMIRFMRNDCNAQYVDQVLANFRQGGVSGQLTGSPYGQIRSILRRHGYAPRVVIQALAFRILRDAIAPVVNWSCMHTIRSKIRDLVPYRVSQSSSSQSSS